MRSARTDRHSVATSPDPAPALQATRSEPPARPTADVPGRAMRCILGVCLATLIIAACSEGDARDARRAQSRDATRESVLSDLQATHNAARFSGTPTPSATRAPDGSGDINVASDDTTDDPELEDEDDDEQPRIVPVGGG